MALRLRVPAWVLLQKSGGACLSFEVSRLCCYPEHLGDHTILRKSISLGDALELSFPDHMLCLIALESSLAGTERAKARLRINAAFEKTMILFDHVV